MKIQKLVEIEIPDPVLPESVKNETLDTITPSQWKSLSEDERLAFRFYWNNKGYASFVCLNCGYPVSHGVSSCEACK